MTEVRYILAYSVEDAREALNEGTAAFYSFETYEGAKSQLDALHRREGIKIYQVYVKVEEV